MISEKIILIKLISTFTEEAISKTFKLIIKSFIICFFFESDVLIEKKHFLKVSSIFLIVEIC